MQYQEVMAWRCEAEAAGQSLKQYVEQHVASDADKACSLAACMGLAWVDSSCLTSAAPRFDVLPIHEALTLRVLAVDIGQILHLVMADPFSRQVRATLLARFAGKGVRQAMSMPGEVDQLLERIASSQRVVDGVEGDVSQPLSDDGIHTISLASIAQDDNPIVRLVNATLYDALQSRASDIHIESTAQGLTIRYRIDGVLQTIRQIPGTDMAAQTLSRLKVLALLDIAERRVPQDGRFKFEAQGREIDLRVSIMPGAHGENAVMRILDRSQRSDAMDLDILGIDALAAARIRALSLRPHGLTLVAGPTGSGKSTTLYAALSEINTGDSKIITIEDPVEYEVPGVLQIPVNERKGLTFARGLRSILRHDPDTIMVGEIRDAETASIAVQSALTGHRVLSSVHANDGFSVIDRFIYMGVEPSTFLEALNGVVSQRLVRRVCRDCAPMRGDCPVHCREMSPHQLRQFAPGPGCETCRHTGYHGRLCLAEVLILDDAMRTALLDRAADKRAQALARDTGFRSIRDAGLDAIRLGQTTYQELQRAVFMQ